MPEKAILIPPSDWTTLYDAWLDSRGGEFLSVLRGNADSLVLQSNMATIARHKTSLYEQLQYIGVSEPTAWEIACQAQARQRIVCTKQPGSPLFDMSCVRTRRPAKRQERNVACQKQASPPADVCSMNRGLRKT